MANEKLVNLDQLKQACLRSKTAIDKVASKIPTDSGVTSNDVTTMAVLTEAEYEALTEKDATTLYLVKEEA